MHRSIALVRAASLFPLMAEQARAATVDISIVGVSAGFDPTTATGGIGDTFHWTNNDGITYTTTQNGPLSLWNSGNIIAGNAFSKRIDFAGSYPYHCSIHTSMTGSVKVPARVTATSGSVGATFAVNVANWRAPSGLAYDVQRKKGSGSWTAWKTGITSKSVTFGRRPQETGRSDLGSARPRTGRRALVAGAVDRRRLGVLARPRC